MTWCNCMACVVLVRSIPVRFELSLETPLSMIGLIRAKAEALFLVVGTNGE